MKFLIKLLPIFYSLYHLSLSRVSFWFFQTLFWTFLSLFPHQEKTLSLQISQGLHPDFNTYCDWRFYFAQATKLSSSIQPLMF
jgi:hypothetical protein